MKTLTYGNLPSFAEFEFEFNCNVGSGDDDVARYDISVRDGSIDKDMFDTLNLIRVWRYVPGKGLGRFESFLDADQLYSLCEALTCLDSESDIEQGVWALSFCSSILTTLGFEWV